MLYDCLQIDKNSSVPLYQQIYNSIKTAVEQGALSKDTKLPSIRKLSDSLLVSKTTVESAYHQLCAEGYIRNVPRSGYRVNAGITKTEGNIFPSESTNPKQEHRIYRFDFGTKAVDNSTANLKVWKKYVRDILNREYLLNTYGEPQGELSLRKSLEKYSFSVRGVNCSENNIVIAAGTQLLLYILCGLMGKELKIAIEKGAYIQAEQAFRDLRHNIVYCPLDKHGVIPDFIKSEKPDFLVLNPNSTGKDRKAMPIERRIKLIKAAKEAGCLVVEDDYNGELRYTTRPIPAMQSLDSNQVVYMGSFSKILLPGVRIGYMVLPHFLLEKYRTVSAYYNQTASKTEQLALSRYIDEGKLEAHLRKARKQYSLKSQKLCECMKSRFKSKLLKYRINETSLTADFLLNTSLSETDIYTLLLNQDINTVKQRDDFNLTLSFSGIDLEKIEEAVDCIYSSLFPSS